MPKLLEMVSVSMISSYSGPDFGGNAGAGGNVLYMYVVYICISVFMNYDCTTHPILLFIT
jgi:hypothetical protein